MADDGPIFKAMPVDDVIGMQKFLAGGLLSSESNRFRLDPLQSYVPKETREKDPAFWMPPPPKKPAKGAGQP